MSIYRHYKGGYYKVITHGIDHQSYRCMVVYKALYDDSIWIRDANEFYEHKVEITDEIAKTRNSNEWRLQGLNAAPNYGIQTCNQQNPNSKITVPRFESIGKNDLNII